MKTFVSNNWYIRRMPLLLEMWQQNQITRFKIPREKNATDILDIDKKNTQQWHVYEQV